MRFNKNKLILCSLKFKAAFAYTVLNKILRKGTFRPHRYIIFGEEATNTL